MKGAFIVSAEAIHAVALGEIDTIYVEPEERFVVSLIVRYDPATSGVQTAEDAARAALGMTRDESASGTTWHVYDRHTGRMHVLRQKDFDPEFDSVVLAGGGTHDDSE